MLEELHWADRAADRVIKDWPKVKTFVCASGITPSGSIHIGNFREIITTQLVSQALIKKGKNVKFIYSWDDYDRFRKVPKNFPKEYEKYLGMSVSDIPDPTKKYSSYAEFLEKELEDSLKPLNFDISFIYQHKKYKSCDYAKDIRHALRNREKIRKILDKYRTEPLEKDWFPLNVYCKKCNKDNIKILGYDEEYSIEYSCNECKSNEVIDFRKDGLVNLPWRVDWPMRWNYEQVNFEPGGKDHSTPGGSFTTGVEISKELWNRNSPTYQMYDFVTVKGAGGKMSSSSGNVLRPKDVLEIYEPEIVKYLFTGTRPNTEFSISFDLDVIKIYEDYDKTERVYYKKENASEKDYLKEKRIYELSAVQEIPKKMPYQPSFRHLTNILLMHQLNLQKTLEYYKTEVKTKFEKNRLKTRAICAKNWLEKYAPEDFKYSVNEKTPKVEMPSKYREAFLELASLLKSNKYDEIKLHQEFYVLIKKFDLNTTEFFTYAYKILISKQKGPKLAKFVLDLGEKAIKLLSKV